MLKIDAHQHFWEFDPIRDAWIDDTMKVIQRDFLPEDLMPILSENGIDACVAIQAEQSEIETAFLLKLAAENTKVQGVVGWVDLVDPDVEESLAHFAENPNFKGVRHIAQVEADDFFLRKEMQRGIDLLAKYGLTYDLLVYAHQLPAAIKLVRQFPNQRFVLDHIAKPKISQGISKNWKRNIKILASYPNVYCKLSGMVTETTNFNWQQNDFRPFIDLILAAFGVNRLMYGSDWPVCLLAASYQEQLTIVQDYIATFSEQEQAKIMGENTVEFYNLSSLNNTL